MRERMDTIPADLETLVFEKSRINEAKLEAFGFLKSEYGYVIRIPFHDGEFRADITVRKDGTVHGTVIETEMEEEYLPLRVASQTSAFVSTIRQEYYDLLCRIREEAFDDQLFVSSQANRLAERIITQWNDAYDRPFERAKESVVFRVPGSQHWYGLVMRVERNKICGGDDSTLVEIINLKADDSEQEKLICETGIYPAWHMNKKKWISVLLDDTLKDDRIFSLIRTSRKLVSGNAVQKASNEWIVPANPNYFDLYSYLRMNSIRDWSQPVNAKPGDIVYIYSAAPDSAIVFKTIVVESDLPNPYYPSSSRRKKSMRLKVVKRYPKELLTMKVLRTFGVRSMQGSKRVPLELKKVIDSLADID